MHALISWLHTTALSMFVASHSWVWPTCETLHFVGLKNFRRILESDTFWRSLSNSLIFTLLAYPVGNLVPEFVPRRECVSRREGDAATHRWRK